MNKQNMNHLIEQLDELQAANEKLIEQVNGEQARFANKVFEYADIQEKCDSLAKQLDELKRENEKLKTQVKKFGNCLQWIKAGVCGMFGSPSKTWEEEVQELVPEAIDKAMSEEEWEGIVRSEFLTLREKSNSLAKQNEILKAAVELYANKKNWKLDYDARRAGVEQDQYSVFTISDSEQVNESVSCCGLKARESLAEVAKLESKS